LIGVAFLIATVTTFVPAFLAAARHLGTLGEDGYMPSSVASLSWLFTLVAVFLLAVGDQNFLVEITDVMVLISLGIIALSGFSFRMGRKRGFASNAMSLVVGLGCFIFGGAIYFVQGGGSVVVFGTMAMIFAYLIFDIIELGTLGAQLFLSVFGFISIVILIALKHVVYVPQVIGIDPNSLLLWGLLVTSVLLATNVFLDVRVLGRTSVR
jgi:hypothetical protein